MRLFLIAVAMVSSIGPSFARGPKGRGMKTTVEIKVSGSRPGRPPQERLLIDTVMHNGESSPRWFVLPTNVPTQTGGGVDVVEVYEYSGKGRALVGRFLGTGGFQALLIPAGGAVTLHGLPLSYWGEPPMRLSLDVTIAQDFTIGAEPAAAWFGGDPTSDAVVEGKTEKAVSSKKSPDGREQPVQFIDGKQVSVSVALLK